MSTRNWSSIACVLLASIVSNSHAQAPRLALVSTERSDAVANVLTLAEVRLSKESKVALVERRALENLLAEQKLTTSGFVKHDQIVRVGKLLGVDLFAVVETDGQKKQAIGLVIFDALTGVRLFDASLPDGGAEPGAEGIEKAVHLALGKFRKFDDSQRTVCLMTVRNADLPRDKDAFCDAVGFFLERGLTSSPDLALLERNRLEQVSKERNLPTDSPVAKLLASLVRVELEIARAANGKGLTATAILFDSQGKMLGKPSIDVAREDAADMGYALVNLVARTIKARPGSKIQDRVKEAQRFGEEAEFYLRHHDLARELRAREAAVALNPDDFKQRCALTSAISRTGSSILSPYQIGAKAPSDDEIRRSLEYAVRALGEVIELETHWYQNPVVRNVNLPSVEISMIATLEKRFKLVHSPETQRLLTTARELNARAVDTHFDLAMTAVKDAKDFASLVERMARTSDISMENPRGLSPAQHRAHTQKYFARFVKIADRFTAAPLSLKTVEHIHVVLKQVADEPTAAERLAQYRANLRKQANPIIRVYDAMLDCQLELAKTKPPSPERAKRLRAFRMLVEKTIASEEGHRTPTLRLAAYRSFCTICVEDPDWKGMDYAHPVAKELAELCRFMTAQGDFEVRTAMDTATHLPRKVSRENEAQSLFFTRALVKLLDSPQCRYLAVDDPGQGPLALQKQSARQFLVARQQQILSRFPDLDAKFVDLLTEVQELIDVQGATTGIVRLGQPRVHDGAVYILALGQENGKVPGRYIQLARFALADGKRTLLGKIAVETGYNPPPLKQLMMTAGQPNGGDNFPFAVDTCIANGRYFVATRDQGIFAFALDGTDVAQFSTTNGLPSNYVQRIAVIDNQLYAGLGQYVREAYLIVLDLKTNQSTLIASSRRKDVQTPFDNLPPWSIRALLPDPNRQRMLFVIETAAKGLSGLWEIDVQTRRLKQLQETKPGLYWLTKPAPDKLLLATFDATTLMDLTNGKSVTKPYDIRKGKMPHVESRLEDVLALMQWKNPSHQLCPGYFLHDGWLWTPAPFGRVAADRKTRELLPSPRKKSSLAFSAYECFHLEGNQVIMADGHGLWRGLLRSASK
jgi:hypothetical protein